MIEIGWNGLGSAVRAIDPRLRVAAAVCFAFAVALSGSLGSASLAAAAAIVTVTLARVPLRVLCSRLFPLNLLLFLLLLSMALTAWVQAPEDMRGVWIRGVAIFLKANAIVVVLTALAGSLSILELGHVLWRLGMPAKGAYLFLLTFRYLDVFHRELERLRMAMRARAFDPGLNMHSLRTLGYLTGMLLVRAFDRAERVHDAIRCRGFCGKFPLVADYRLGMGDMVFGFIWTTLLACVVAGNFL